MDAMVGGPFANMDSMVGSKDRRLLCSTSEVGAEKYWQEHILDRVDEARAYTGEGRTISTGTTSVVRCGITTDPLAKFDRQQLVHDSLVDYGCSRISARSYTDRRREANRGIR
jgi:hypothetical protein